MRRFLLSVFFALPFLLAHRAPLGEPYYLSAKAERGDGAKSLMARYDLPDSDCNLKHFYHINDLKAGAALKRGFVYKLPILVYDYDGKSIRSSIGINDWDLAVRIQKWNNGLSQKKIREGSYTDSKILWVPYADIYCRPEDKATTSSEKRHFPIFGPDHAHVPLLSSKLAGQVFYVVGGHGGADPGAIGKYKGKQLCEDEYAYDVALRLARILLSHGATVYLVTRDDNDGIRSGEILPCDSDEYSWPKQAIFRGQKARLTQRSQAINKLYDENKRKGRSKQTMVEIHVDSRGAKQRADVFFYYHKSSAAGKKLAQRVQKVFKAKYARYRANGEYHGTISARDLHMLRECKPVSLYVELGNIRNASDQKRFVLESNRQYLAEWLAEGLM